MIDDPAQCTMPIARPPRPWRGPRIPRTKWIAPWALVLLCAGVNLGDRPFGVAAANAQLVEAEERSTTSAGSGEEIAAEPSEHGVASRSRRETLLASLTIFVLAVFLGFELITKVPPTLHTPLMSGSNAISGITLVGAIVATGVTTASWWVTLWGALAVILATINAVGGFAVTHRMLSMFRRN